MDTTRRLIIDSKHLPTMPAAAVRLVELSRAPDTTIHDLREVIQTDPVISAKVLAAANASFFGLRTEVTSLDKAALLLGPGRLTAIALTFYLAQQSVVPGPVANLFRAYWLQTVIQATAAETVLKFAKLAGDSTAFLAGLLCDVGKLALLRAAPKDFAAAMAKSGKTGNPSYVVEQEFFAIDHIGVGLQLASGWGLPEAILDAMRYHHAAAADIETLETTPEKHTIASVIVASAVADHLCGSHQVATWTRLCTACRELFDFTDDEIVEYLSQVVERVTEASHLFDLDTSQLPDVSLVLADANSLLAENALQMHAVTHQAIAEREQLREAKQQLEREKSELRGQVIRDQLTGLYSRKFFEGCLHQEIRRCAELGSSIGLIFCDIDHFKRINDQYGHQFGDTVLKIVATTLQASLLDADVVARFGGEEFVAILTNNSIEDLEQAAERMRKAIARLCIEENHGAVVPVTVSVGACCQSDLHQDDAADIAASLVQEADEAMYRSKRNGRNQTQIAVLS